MKKIKLDKLKQLCATNNICHRDMNAKTLRALRLSLNLTQTEMGEKLGISRDAVAKLEAGKNKMSRPVELLAIALDSKP